MKKIKVLNLYAGIGGNRKLWPERITFGGVTYELEITAVELNPEIAAIYQTRFPNDTVIIANAHDYLLEHYGEYDFIWSSTPCQRNSQIRFRLGVQARGNVKPMYPDLRLYEEFIFLDNHFKGKFIIENTIAYYSPLIQPQEVAKHWFWANFVITQIKKKSRCHHVGIEELALRKGVDLSMYGIKNKRQILRNCVEPELGLHIFNCAFKETQQTLG